MEVIIKIGIHFIHLKEKHNLRFIKIVPDRIIPVGCQNNCLGVNPFNNVPFCLCFLSHLAYSWYNLWRRARKKKTCCNYFCCHLLETIWQIRLQKRWDLLWYRVLQYYCIVFNMKGFCQTPPTPRHSKPTFKAFQKEGKQPTNQASKVRTGYAWSTGYTMTEFLLLLWQQKILGFFFFLYCLPIQFHDILEVTMQFVKLLKQGFIKRDLWGQST